MPVLSSNFRTKKGTNSKFPPASDFSGLCYWGLAANEFNTLRLLSVASILPGLALAILFGLSRGQDIVLPLCQAVAISNAIVFHGDLSGTLSTEGQDEIAALMHALSDVQTSLGKVVTMVH